MSHQKKETKQKVIIRDRKKKTNWLRFKTRRLRTFLSWQNEVSFLFILTAKNCTLQRD